MDSSDEVQERTIYSKTAIQEGTQFGPYPGKDAVERKFSEWMAFVSKVQTFEESNLITFYHEGQKYYRTRKEIHPFEPFLVWEGTSQTSSITRTPARQAHTSEPSHYSSISSTAGGQISSDYMNQTSSTTRKFSAKARSSIFAQDSSAPSTSGGQISCNYISKSSQVNERNLSLVMEKRTPLRTYGTKSPRKIMSNSANFKSVQKGQVNGVFAFNDSSNKDPDHLMSTGSDYEVVGEGSTSSSLQINFPDNEGEWMEAENSLFDCPECGEKYVSLAGLALHKVLHLQESKCSGCGVMFTRNNKLNDHIKTHPPSKISTCTECVEAFGKAYDMQPFVPRMLKTLLCINCMAIAKVRWDMKIAAKKVGNEWRCQICKKKFSIKRSLQCHLNQHGGKYTCLKCNKAFGTYRILVQHIVLHTDYCPYECTKCGTRFKWKAVLTTHKEDNCAMKKRRVTKHRLVNNGMIPSAVAETQTLQNFNDVAATVQNYDFIERNETCETEKDGGCFAENMIPEEMKVMSTPRLCHGMTHCLCTSEGISNELCANAVNYLDPTQNVQRVDGPMGDATAIEFRNDIAANLGCDPYDLMDLTVANGLSVFPEKLQIARNDLCSNDVVGDKLNQMCPFSMQQEPATLIELGNETFLENDSSQDPLAMSSIMNTLSSSMPLRPSIYQRIGKPHLIDSSLRTVEVGANDDHLKTADDNVEFRVVTDLEESSVSNLSQPKDVSFQVVINDDDHLREKSSSNVDVSECNGEEEKEEEEEERNAPSDGDKISSHEAEVPEEDNRLLEKSDGQSSIGDSSINNVDFNEDDASPSLDHRCGDREEGRGECLELSRNEDSHEETEGDFSCLECKESFQSNVGLLLHQSIHSDTSTCATCGKVYSRELMLRRHLATHSSAEIKSCFKCRHILKSGFNYENNCLVSAQVPLCFDCIKFFNVKCEVDTRKCWTKNGRNLYQCNVCSKTYNREKSVMYHVNIHFDRFVCGECNLSFTRFDNLTRHVLVHTGYFPYKCEKCNKQFKSFWQMKHKCVSTRARNSLNFNFSGVTVTSLDDSNGADVLKSGEDQMTRGDSNSVGNEDDPEDPEVSSNKSSLTPNVAENPLGNAVTANHSNSMDVVIPNLIDESVKRMSVKRSCHSYLEGKDAIVTEPPRRRLRSFNGDGVTKKNNFCKSNNVGANTNHTIETPTEARFENVDSVREQMNRKSPLHVAPLGNRIIESLPSTATTSDRILRSKSPIVRLSPIRSELPVVEKRNCSVSTVTESNVKSVEFVDEESEGSSDMDVLSCLTCNRVYQSQAGLALHMVHHFSKRNCFNCSKKLRAEFRLEDARPRQRPICIKCAVQFGNNSNENTTEIFGRGPERSTDTRVTLDSVNSSSSVMGSSSNKHNSFDVESDGQVFPSGSAIFDSPETEFSLLDDHESLNQIDEDGKETLSSTSTSSDNSTQTIHPTDLSEVSPSFGNFSLNDSDTSGYVDVDAVKTGGLFENDAAITDQSPTVFDLAGDRGFEKRRDNGTQTPSRSLGNTSLILKRVDYTPTDQDDFFHESISEDVGANEKVTPISTVNVVATPRRITRSSTKPASGVTRESPRLKNNLAAKLIKEMETEAVESVYARVESWKRGTRSSLKRSKSTGDLETANTNSSWVIERNRRFAEFQEIETEFEVSDGSPNSSQDKATPTQKLQIESSQGSGSDDNVESGLKRRTRNASLKRPETKRRSLRKRTLSRPRSANLLPITQSDKEFACKVCGRAFVTRSNLSNHLSTHDVRTPFRCTVCNRHFKSEKSVMCHATTFERNLRCEICTLTVKGLSLLTRHYSVHDRRKEFVARKRENVYFARHS